MSSMNDQIKTIMTADENGSELVDFAQETAERLVKDNLGRTQIRNIFTEARKIEASWPSTEAMRRLNMLKPKLAYQTKRNPQVKYLDQVLSAAISEVNAAPDETTRNIRFERFVDLFEAILAYHRALGGRN